MKHIFTMILCCLLLTACTTAGPEGSTAPSSAETTPAKHTLTVFYPDENLEGFLTAQSELDAIDEHVILHELVHAVPLDHDIQVNSFTQNGTELRLDLSSEFSDMIQAVGSTGERMVMGSVVNTYLTAYDAVTISITADGKTIESGHVIYDFPMELFR